MVTRLLRSLRLYVYLFLYFFLLLSILGLAARGQAAVRDAKGYFSSDFEALLLAATKPNDSERPPDARYEDCTNRTAREL